MDATLAYSLPGHSCTAVSQMRHHLDEVLPTYQGLVTNDGGDFIETIVRLMHPCRPARENVQLLVAFDGRANSGRPELHNLLH